MMALQDLQGLFFENFLKKIKLPLLEREFFYISIDITFQEWTKMVVLCYALRVT